MHRKVTFQQQIKLTAIPGILGVGILYLLPGCALFYYASINNVFQKEFVGLQNLIDILSNPYFLMALKNTSVLLTAAMAAVLVTAFVLMLPDAFYGWHMFLAAVLLLIPLFMPSVISVKLLQLVGGSLSPRLQLLSLFVWRNTGAVLLLFCVGLRKVEKETLEAACLDGANRLQLFIFIQIPVLFSYIGIGMVFLIMQFFGIFRET